MDVVYLVGTAWSRKVKRKESQDFPTNETNGIGSDEERCFKIFSYKFNKYRATAGEYSGYGGGEGSEGQG